MRLKRTLLIVALLVAAAAAPTAVAAGQLGCYPGLKPLPPFGCRDLYSVCTIDADGNAHIQWVCVPYDRDRKR